ncbi:hypothetical protein AAFF_G00067710 [Aldrovandia affinis]|uniref:Uncharacterized protein n=1 Tax=Aldrovandia affinis TaxID=143900 RepID=A0AAD7WDU3_9TELE|nr:hypothetical protein AAFF_G00067710 [Aldrovandia affinis]
MRNARAFRVLVHVQTCPINTYPTSISPEQRTPQGVWTHGTPNCALNHIIRNSTRFTGMGGNSPQPPPMCSTHLSERDGSHSAPVQTHYTSDTQWRGQEGESQDLGFYLPIGTTDM